jgi:hypothetical protein
MGLLALGLIAAACGRDDDSSSEPTEETTQETTQETTEETTEETTDVAVEETTDVAVEVIEEYRIAYNADDMDGVMALFTEESVLTGHAGLDTSWTGLDEIRESNVVDRASAAEADAYVFVNVEANGDTVTWNHTWLSATGVEWCGEGHSAVIGEGKFVTWTYAPANQIHPCSPDCALADAFADGQAPDVCDRPSS